MSDAWVPARLKAEVYEYVNQAGTALGLIQPIQVEWHAGSYAGSQDKYYAWYMGNTEITQLEPVIHVNVSACGDLPSLDLKFLLFHEARHYWQWLTSRYIGDEAEKDADEFAGRQVGTPEKLQPYYFWKLK